MRQINNLLFAGIACSCLLLFVAGCNRSSDIPDPPHAKAALTLQLCYALKNKNYQLAEKKVERLEIIEPNEAFLENIKNRLQNNQTIIKVQSFLDSGDLVSAEKSVRADIKLRGQNVTLVSMLNQLQQLGKIKQLIKDLLSAGSSRKVAVCAARLNKAISKYPSAKVLYGFANKKLDYARRLLAIEKKLAVEDLKADIDIAWVKGAPYLDSMIAGLEVENSKDPIVLAYKKAMQNNWANERPDNIYYEPEDEFILLRKGLLSEGIKEKKEIYNVLLSLPPDNFRSLLIRVILLRIAGYSKEASELETQIIDSLSIPSDISSKWQHLKISKLIEFKNLNPFVLYPFFIYYENS